MRISQLKLGQRAIIKEFSIDQIPLKLIELGCLPGNEVQLLHVAPFRDPMYLNMNGNHLAIRKETAEQIEIDVLP